MLFLRPREMKKLQNGVKNEFQAKIEPPYHIENMFLFPRSVQDVFNWMTRGFKLIFMNIKFVDEL